jgi:hypothetical protein
MLTHASILSFGLIEYMRKRMLDDTYRNNIKNLKNTPIYEWHGGKDYFYIDKPTL